MIQEASTAVRSIWSDAARWNAIRCPCDCHNQFFQHFDDAETRAWRNCRQLKQARRAIVQADEAMQKYQDQLAQDAALYIDVKLFSDHSALMDKLRKEGIVVK